MMNENTKKNSNNNLTSNQTNKNNLQNISYSEDNIFINAEENFRVITSSDFEEEISPTKKETNKLENQKFAFAYKSNEAIRYPLVNDKYLEEINIYDMMPNKIQTDVYEKESKYSGMLPLKELSDKKPTKTLESSADNEENHNIQIINETASDKNTNFPHNQPKINNYINNNLKNYKTNKLKRNTERNESFNSKDKSKAKTDKLLMSLKIKSDNRASRNSFSNIINKSNMNNNNNNNNNNEFNNKNNCRLNSNGKPKTIFTIMSEEILNHMTAKKNAKTNELINKNEKINLYEKMINENNLHKISEKINKHSKEISKNFLTRNIKDSKLREFKKKMHYTTTNSEQILSSITRPQSALSSKKPVSINSKNNIKINNYYNNKDKDKERKSVNGKRVRSPEKFFEDQIKWEEVKLSILERERIRFIDKNNGLLRAKPLINKKSVELATRNNTRFNCFMKSSVKKEKSQGKINASNVIHDYLTKMKIGNFKHNKDAMYKSMYASPKNQKQLPEKDIKILIEKLYNEKNQKQGKIRSFSNETETTNKHQYFQTGNSSNLLVLKDFLDRLFFTLQEEKFVNQTDKKLENSLLITYEDFNCILHKAGFLKFDHNLKVTINKNEIESLINNNGFLNEQKLKEQESVLLKDAWKILISQNTEASNNSLDFNILIIFLIAILGIYKGDDRKQMNNNRGEDNANSKTNELINNLNEKSNILLENNINTNSNEFIAKSSNELSIQNNQTNNLYSLNTNNFYQHDPKNSFVMTFAKSPLTTNLNNANNNFYHLHEHPKNKKHLNLSMDKKPNCLSHANNNNNKRIILEKINKENAYLLMIVTEINKFFPNFNYNNLVYNRNVTNQIRVIFREFFENWADKIFANKKTKRSISVESKIKENNFSFKPKIDKSTNNYFARYRNKILSNHTSNLISSTNEKYEDSTSNIFTERNRKIVALDEIYENLKIKKERELEQERAEKLKKEMLECTFSPKISRRSRALLNSPKLNSREISEKLYSEARSISNRKTNRFEERKALDEESINSFPYSPRIQSLDKSIFSNSPTRNDPSLGNIYERYEKSRIDKKLKEILTKTGSNINTIKNIESCLGEEKKDEKRPRFRFDNEHHSHKNTLDSKFKIKEIKKISDAKNNNNVKSRLFSKSNTKTYFNINNKTNRNANDLSELDSIIKIVIDVQVSKNKKFKFEFLSNQDPVILTQRFILQNELLELSDFKKQDIFEQINDQIKKFNNNSKLFLSQIQS